MDYYQPGVDPIPGASSSGDRDYGSRQSSTAVPATAASLALKHGRDDAGGSPGANSAFPASEPFTQSAHADEGSHSEGGLTALTTQTLNADGTPKRPMNAFMIFARKRRPEVSAANISMRTGEISKILSNEWSSMDTTQKQFYQDQAKKLKETFNSKYPDYVYRRRPNNSRKRRKTDASLGHRADSSPESRDDLALGLESDSPAGLDDPSTAFIPGLAYPGVAASPPPASPAYKVDPDSSHQTVYGYALPRDIPGPCTAPANPGRNGLSHPQRLSPPEGSYGLGVGRMAYDSRSTAAMGKLLMPAKLNTAAPPTFYSPDSARPPASADGSTAPWLSSTDVADPSFNGTGAQVRMAHGSWHPVPPRLSMAGGTSASQYERSASSVSNGSSSGSQGFFSSSAPTASGRSWPDMESSPTLSTTSAPSPGNYFPTLSSPFRPGAQGSQSSAPRSSAAGRPGLQYSQQRDLPYPMGVNSSVGEQRLAGLHRDSSTQNMYPFSPSSPITGRSAFTGTMDRAVQPRSSHPELRALAPIVPTLSESPYTLHPAMPSNAPAPAGARSVSDFWDHRR